MQTPDYMTAKEAAAELNVSLATLYAYVSRGIIRSEAKAGTRTRRYLAADIRALADKSKITTRHNDETHPLSFGAPVLESEITFIDGQRLYYRGRDAADLAISRESLESVAALIWDCEASSCFLEPPPELPDASRLMPNIMVDQQPLIYCQALLPLIGQRDIRAYDFSVQGAARTGAVVLRLMVALITRTQLGVNPVHETLAGGWQVGAYTGLIRAALILAADHELNASTFTVRIAASAGVSIYQAVAAGLATLQGARHGGEIERTFRLLQEICGGAQNPAEVVAGWMRRGDIVPGFGHTLYQQADPRAQVLLSLMQQQSCSEQQEHLLRAVKAMGAVVGRALNFEGALAVMMMYLDLSATEGLCVLAIGRTVGWAGHAIEQYQDHRLIRPRARYVGLR